MKHRIARIALFGTLALIGFPRTAPAAAGNDSAAFCTQLASDYQATLQTCLRESPRDSETSAACGDSISMFAKVWNNTCAAP